ncbi:MAG: energy transducer TonB [Bryobacteraceae bacterium]
MFEQTFMAGTQGRKARSVVLAFVLQAAAVGVIIVVPLMFVQPLPRIETMSYLLAPSPPPPPPPPPPAGRAAPVRPVKMAVTPKIFNPATLTEPKTVPRELALNQPQIAPPAPMAGEVGGVAGGVPGGQVEAARLEHEVLPVYPVLASEARVHGTVRLSAVIGKDGHVEDLKLISGHPLLVDAAMSAVRQWIYQPTYLNSKPMEVETEIDVNFQQD